MLNVVIASGGRPESLARTLSSLIPAIPQGVLRDGCIADRDGSPECEAIADAAGCSFVKGGPGEAVLPASGADWRLLICSGVVLEEGWWREVADFIGNADMHGAHPKPAAFTYANPRYGLSARMDEWLRLCGHYLPGQNASHAAILSPDHLDRAGRAMDMPVSLPARAVRLRSRAFVPVK